jgi:ubiquinone/menaquinone biosynthesis C-methylase UbiE
MSRAEGGWRGEWFYRVAGAPYAFVFGSKRLSRAAGWLLWRWDVRHLHRSLSAISETPENGLIVDVPCGGGIAFRGLGREQRVRYVAADISRGMLRRARRLARRRGLGQIELVEADVRSLPLENASVDLCLCFNGLDCFPEPAEAVAELARCLRPGGRLVGDTVVRGAGPRFDRLIALYQRRRIFGPGGTSADLDRWLEHAGLADVRIWRSGAVAHFTARKPE